MSEAPNPETDSAADTDLKRRLLGRIAVAAVIMVALLGSLAIFDALNAPEPAPAKMAALSPAVVSPPAAEPAKEEPAAEVRPGDAAAPAAQAATGDAAVPEGTASPAAPPLQPLPAEKRLTRPATGRSAAMRPSEPVPPAASPAARPDPSRELAAAPAAPPATRRAPASRPVSQAGERQFALQMGVFGNLANAEDLRAKLEMNGIPASIEARVRVGPFKTREEVEAARARLKELGLDDGLLLTMKPKSN